jgi:hypothetical protein
MLSWLVTNSCAPIPEVEDPQDVNYNLAVMEK